MPRDDDEALAQEREWQAIVDNYGDRPVLEPEDEVGPDLTAAPEAAEPEGRTVPTVPTGPTGPAEPEPVAAADEFVPPTPPPLPRPPADRLAAWLGVFGVPTVVLVCIVLGISLPAWAGLLLAAGFVGGFVYLVARLPGSPPDPWDDGARL